MKRIRFLFSAIAMFLMFVTEAIPQHSSCIGPFGVIVCNPHNEICSCGVQTYICDYGGMYCNVPGQQSCSMACNQN